MKEDQADEKYKFKLIFLYCVYFFILIFLYRYYVNKYWDYLGFSLDENYRHLAISLGVISFFIVALPRGFDARHFFLNLAMTIGLLPALVLYSAGGALTSWALVGWLALVVVFLASSIPMSRISLADISPKGLMVVVAALIAGFLGFFVLFGGIANFNLDFSRVYDFREAAEEALPGIFGYLSPIFSKAVVPFGVAVSLYYRNYVMTIIFVISSVIIFGFTSHKGVLFYPIMSAIIFLILNRTLNYSFFLYFMILGLFVSCFDSFMLVEAGKIDGVWGIYSNLLVRRSLMVPALLDYHYIEFFSNNPWFLWSSSRISLGLTSNPYAATAPFVIGEAYLGSLNTSANTGYVGSGFAQAGLVGTILYATGVGLVIAFMRAQARVIGLPLVAAIMTAPTVTMFSSTDFLALFLTHGMFVSLTLLTLIKSRPQRAML